MADGGVTEHEEVALDVTDDVPDTGQLVINWWFSCIWGTVGGLVLIAWVVHWIQVREVCHKKKQEGGNFKIYKRDFNENFCSTKRFYRAVIRFTSIKM